MHSKNDVVISLFFNHSPRGEKKIAIFASQKNRAFLWSQGAATGEFEQNNIMIAEIAQLVEHDLAKVGVAGSSPVFRSKAARMVESVDTQDLKSCGHCGCVGSSPTSGTFQKGLHLCVSPFFAFFAITSRFSTP